MSLLPDPILEGVGDSLLTATDRCAYTVSVPRMDKIVGREGVKALRSVIRGQHFTPVVVMEHATRKSTLSSADADTVPMSDGASTCVVDARGLGELEILVAFVPPLLSYAGTLTS